MTVFFSQNGTVRLFLRDPLVPAGYKHHIDVVFAVSVRRKAVYRFPLLFKIRRLFQCACTVVRFSDLIVTTSPVRVVNSLDVFLFKLIAVRREFSAIFRRKQPGIAEIGVIAVFGNQADMLRNRYADDVSDM